MSRAERRLAEYVFWLGDMRYTFWKYRRDPLTAQFFDPDDRDFLAACERSLLDAAQEGHAHVVLAMLRGMNEAMPV